jgi:hypothetical protein
MVPVSSRSSTSSPDEAGLGTDPRVATLAAKELVCPPARVPSPLAFELRCADAHLVGCAAVLGAESAGDVVALAHEHGARLRGFTTVWYDPQRLAVIAAAVTRPGGGTR